MNTRKAQAHITYLGADITQDIAPFLMSMSYTDNGANRADDLSLTLADRDGRWHNMWMPENGDEIQAEIQLENWYGPGMNRVLACGTFAVDSLSLGGPPDSISIQALSYPGNDAIKNETHTRSWEVVTLRQIAARIAASAGMTLMFETEDIRYDRLEQNQESDLSFLASICEKEGVSLKITNHTLVLLDDRAYEEQPPVRTLTRGESDILSYSFNRSVVGAAYTACEVSYFDSTANRTIQGAYRLPGSSGPILKLNERVASEAEAIRKAKKALYQKNKEAQRASLTVMGDYALAQGLTVQLAGFGKFDEKYLIESARHEVGRSGYRTTLEIRRVLAYV
ncbi:late control protein [Xylanibacillus composti]|uniref:Phage protein D n=1 Tax=Xylanibacillus composti TaxID=1572762 RepID=A0A8J4H5W1_9BACL|nr:contractile injection system protein, VgrG/Pvc8 family [Xylanibacillus composti]MDT9724268.1 late control protein [Xylanibacillus composti]GIQ69263.1 hypothetical protein XYCOK13_20870 [Xylanibacillus composti]